MKGKTINFLRKLTLIAIIGIALAFVLIMVGVPAYHLFFSLGAISKVAQIALLVLGSIFAISLVIALSGAGTVWFSTVVFRFITEKSDV